MHLYNRNSLYLSTCPNKVQVKCNNLSPYARTFGPMRTPFLRADASETKRIMSIKSMMKIQ